MHESRTRLLLCMSLGMLAAACKQQGRTSLPPARAAGERAPVAPGHGATLPARTPRQARPSSPEGAPAPESLFDSLTRELGADGPVAIVPAAAGVVAVALNGAGRSVLVVGPARWVFVDDRSRVVWFQRVAGAFSELWLVDLTQPAPEPEQIMIDLPRDEQLAVGYAASAPSETDDIVHSSSSVYDGCTELWLNAARPSTKFVEGLYDIAFEREQRHRRASAKAKIVAEAVPKLQQLALRGQGRRLLLPETSTARPDRVRTVARSRCEQPDLCGTAQPIPGTRLLRVLIEHSCGDACHAMWQLYDPATSEFVDFRTQRRSAQPIETGPEGNMNDAYVSPNGDGFVIDGDVFRTGGVRVFDGEGARGGWLGGQSYIGP